MTDSHEADAVFALAHLPRTATVDPDLEVWRRGLEVRGIEVVERGGEVHVGRAVPEGAEQAIVVKGRPTRVADKQLQGLASLPPDGSPAFYFSARAPRATAYAFRNVIPSPTGLRGLRNRAVAALGSAGVPLPLPRRVTLLTSSPGVPALVRRASEVVDAGELSWFLVVAFGSITRRCTFVCFRGRDAEPSFVVKFGRAPGVTAQFERDERAYAAVAAAGGPVGAHAPTWFGRCDLGGHAVGVESAAVGRTMTAVLAGRAERLDRLSIAERGARWLLDVARHTAGPPGSLDAAVAAVRDEVLSGSDAGDLRSLVDRIRAPSVFTHGEVFEDHIVLAGDRLSVIDWEHANPRGFPLWDLAFYGANVLALVDSFEDRSRRDDYALRLFAGEAPSSRDFFGWVREHSSALGISQEDVAAIVAAYWQQRSELSRRERERAETASGSAVEPSWLERLGRRWLEHPALGAGWKAWSA